MSHMDVVALCHYALRAAMCLTVMYAAYLLAMRGTASPRLCRAALLSILLLSVVISLVDIPWLHGKAVEQAQDIMVPIEFDMISDREHKAAVVDRLVWLSVVYMVGAAATLLWHVATLVWLRRRIVRGCLWHRRERGLHIYCHAGYVVPFSWMHSVVISQSDYEHNADTILAHEAQHVRLHHSADILLVMAVQALQWFNPAAWHMIHSLRQVHEYEADRAVIAGGTSVCDYQRALLARAMGCTPCAIAHGLGSTGLEKRFKMMNRRTTWWHRIGVSLLMLVGCLAATGMTVVGLHDIHVYSSYVTDTAPLFLSDIDDYMARNSVYPQECAETMQEARLLVRMVINRHGYVERVSVQDPPNEAFAVETERLLRQMPRWTPATVNGRNVAAQVTFMVNFKMNELQVKAKR